MLSTSTHHNSEYSTTTEFQTHATATASQHRSDTINANDIVNEDLWIQLYHQLLLMLARHKSSPIIDYFNPGVAQRLDAYLQGLLDHEGNILHTPPARTAEQILQLETKCEHLVPMLVHCIKMKAAENAFLWPETCLAGDEVREKLWVFRITAHTVGEYRRVRDACGFRGSDDNADEYPELFSWLMAVVDDNYTFARQRERVPGEIFDVGPVDERVVVAKFHVHDLVTGNEYIQLDKIPELQSSNDDDNGAEAEAEAEPQHFLIPEPLTLLIPPKIKDRPWVYNQATNVWLRADGKTWRPTVLVREFRSPTMEYVHCHLDLLKTRNADPNDDAYKKVYNQWQNQIRRRVLKVITLPRVHWTPDERTALYRAINVWCREKGVDEFAGRGMQNADLMRAVDRVNRVLGRQRTVASLRMQIRNAVYKKRGPVYRLWLRAEEVRRRVEEGEEVGGEERFPLEAIPISEDAVAEDEDEHEEDDGDGDGDGDKLVGDDEDEDEYDELDDMDVDSHFLPAESAQTEPRGTGEQKLYLRLRFCNDSTR